MTQYSPPLIVSLSCFFSVFEHGPEKEDARPLQGDWRAAEYALELVSSGWNDPALKATFHCGLNEDILTELVCHNENVSSTLLSTSPSTSITSFKNSLWPRGICLWRSTVLHWNRCRCLLCYYGTDLLSKAYFYVASTNRLGSCLKLHWSSYCQVTSTTGPTLRNIFISF